LAQDNIIPTPRKGEKLNGKGSKPVKEKHQAKRKIIEDDVTDDDEFGSDTPLYEIHKRNIKLKYEDDDSEGFGQEVEDNKATLIGAEEIKKEMKQEEDYDINHEEEESSKNDEQGILSFSQINNEAVFFANTKPERDPRNESGTSTFLFESNLISMSTDLPEQVIEETTAVHTVQSLGTVLPSVHVIPQMVNLNQDLEIKGISS
jgi:hypothetical protein